jgi:uncharacterized membrane protein YjdF
MRTDNNLADEQNQTKNQFEHLGLHWMIQIYQKSNHHFLNIQKIEIIYHMELFFNKLFVLHIQYGLKMIEWWSMAKIIKKTNALKKRKNENRLVLIRKIFRKNFKMNPNF